MIVIHPGALRCNSEAWLRGEYAPNLSISGGGGVSPHRMKETEIQKHENA